MQTSHIIQKKKQICKLSKISITLLTSVCSVSDSPPTHSSVFDILQAIDTVLHLDDSVVKIVT